MTSIRPFIELSDDIVPVDESSAVHLGAVIARAFKDDPLNKWLFKNESCMRHTFIPMAQHIYGPHGICHTLGEGAAAMWLEPGKMLPIPKKAIPGMALRVLKDGGITTLGRIIAADKGISAHKPKDPFVYLFAIGVTKEQQGQGLGKRLMAPVLSACDRVGQPVYLESSNPDNHSFYASFGFKRVELFSPVEGSPPIEAMWRDPAR